MDLKSLRIIYYPHPTLRHVSRPIARVDSALRDAIRGMFPLMYEARGIGLAANQINLPLRVFVLNLEAEPNEGEEFVFINPVISQPRGVDEKEEGCLSMPGVNGIVRRPERVRIQAYDLQGRPFDATVDGLFARAVQHEVDHLDGVLFTDRLSETKKIVARADLDLLESDYRSKQQTGELPAHDTIAAHIREIENRYA